MPLKLTVKYLECIVKTGIEIFLGRLSFPLHEIPLLIWIWQIWKLLAAVRTASSPIEQYLEGDPLFTCLLKPDCKIKCSLNGKENFNLPDKSKKIALRNHALIAFILN